jgi:hypothetical protein
VSQKPGPPGQSAKLTFLPAVVCSANLFTETYLHGHPILRFPRSNTQKQAHLSQDAPVEPSRLWSCAKALRTWYDYLLSLPTSEFSGFSAMEWGHFVTMIVLGLRLSFPLPNECPSWDHAAAREVIALGSFLDKFTQAGSHTQAQTPESSVPSSGTDVLAASKVVLGVVKHKYEMRLAALQRAALAQPPHPVPADVDAGLHKCPMFDGSLDPLIASWDDTFLDPSSLVDPSLMGPGPARSPGPVSSSGTQPVVYHDLWATMTMGWSQDNLATIEFDSLENQTSKS